MIQQGLIPESQYTDEEMAKLQQAQADAQNQPPQEDPNALIAQAEMGKAQAEQMNAQNKQMEIQGNQQLKAQELQLKQQQLQLDAQKFQMSKDDKFNVDAAKIQQGQQKLDQDAWNAMQQMALKLTELEQKYQTQLNSEMLENTLIFDPVTGEFANA